MKQTYRSRLICVALGVSLGMAGCASIHASFGIPTLLSQPVGSSEHDIRKVAGEPESRVPEADGGYSLIYSAQPSGTQCVVLRFDKDGKLIEAEDRLSVAGRTRIVTDLDAKAFLTRMCAPIERLKTAHPYEILSWNMEPLDASQPRRFDVYLQAGKVHHTDIRTLYFQAVR